MRRKDPSTLRVTVALLSIKRLCIRSDYPPLALEVGGRGKLGFGGALIGNLVDSDFEPTQQRVCLCFVCAELSLYLLCICFSKLVFNCFILFTTLFVYLLLCMQLYVVPCFFVFDQILTLYNHFVCW